MLHIFVADVGLMRRIGPPVALILLVQLVVLEANAANPQAAQSDMYS